MEEANSSWKGFIGSDNHKMYPVLRGKAWIYNMADREFQGRFMQFDGLKSMLKQ